MSAFKRILSGWKALLAIAVFLSALLFALLFHTAPVYAADDSYKISLQTQEGEYGNPLFSNAEISDGVIKLYGTLSDKTFEIVDLSEKESATHYVTVKNLYASINSTVYKFIDQDGKIIAPPSSFNYSLELSYTDGDSTVYSFVLYEKETGNRVKFISSFATTNQGKFTVTQKKMSVVLDETAFASGVVEDEGEYKIINRTYGETPLNIVFAPSTSLAFADHQMDWSVSIEGNETLSNVGDYSLSVDNDKVNVKDGNGVDVTDYYDISCDQKIKIRVNKLSLTAPARKELINYYSDVKVERDDDNNIISTPFDIEFKEDNVWGHAGWTAYYKGYLICEDEDLDDDRIKVTGSDKVLYFRIELDSVFGGYDLDLNNFTLNYQESNKSDYSTHILKRNVTVYLEGHAAASYDKDFSIAISPDGFSKQYGAVYTKENSLDNVKIQSTFVTVEFEIDKFEELLAKEGALVVGDGLILDVGNYPIVNPHVVENDCYEVVFDPNVYYSVTQKIVSLSDLVANENNVTEVSISGEDLVLDTFSYGDANGDKTYSFKFKDPDIDIAPDVELVALFSLEDGAPSVYRAKSATSLNYKAEDNQKLCVVVQKIVLTVDYPASFEYSKSYILPSVSGENSALELDYDVVFSTGKTFSDKNALSAPPVDVGQYSYKVVLTSGNTSYTFDGGDTFTGSFSITKRVVRAVVTFKSNYKVFGDVVSMKDVASFDIYYDPQKKGTSTEKGLIADDALGALSFDGKCNEKSALPGDYHIRFDEKAGDGDNYSVWKVYYVYNGKTTSDLFHVYKLSLSSFISQKVAVVNKRTATVDSSSITLPALTLFGSNLDNLALAYCKSGEEEYEIASGLKIDGLEEGTTYSVRYVLKRASKLVDLSQDYFGDAVDITTTLFSPEISQYVDLTTSNSVGVEIENYDEDNVYSYTFGEEKISILNSDVVVIKTTVDEEEILKYVYVIKDLEPSTVYQVVFIRSTQFAESASDELRINTAAATPTINKGDFAVTTNAITIALSDDALSDGETIGYEYIKINTGYTSFGSLSDKDAGNLSEYFEKNGSKVTIGEGVEIASLEADSLYYFKFYVIGSEENHYVKGDAIYYELHTDPEEVEPTKEEGFIASFSKYLVVGTAALFLILFIIVLIKLISIQKKYRRA